MKFLAKWLLLACFGTLLAACVATTSDPAVGKADFAKLEQWLQNVERLLEQDLAKAKPENEEEAVKLIEGLFEQAISQAKALHLRHIEVIELRDKLVQGLDYQHPVLRSMISPVYMTETNVDEFYSTVERLAEEIEELYEKLSKTFGEE